MVQIHDLPLDVLTSLCDILAAEHNPSLFAFSTVNTGFCDAALPFIVRDIRFTLSLANSISRPPRLDQDVARWLDFLTRYDCLRHVQRVRICAVDEPNAPSVRDHLRYRLSLAGWWTVQGIDRFSPLAMHDGRFLPQYIGSESSSSSHSAPNEDEEGDAGMGELWSSLANFLARLPALADVHWDVSNLLPQCILDALHDQHSAQFRSGQCCLHLGALLCTTLTEAQISPRELALLSSPCLHSLVLITGYDAAYAEEREILRAVVGLAPNLRHLALALPGALSPVDVPQQFRDLTLQHPENAPYRKGALEGLTLLLGGVREGSLEDQDATGTSDAPSPIFSSHDPSPRPSPCLSRASSISKSRSATPSTQTRNIPSSSPAPRSPPSSEDITLPHALQLGSCWATAGAPGQLLASSWLVAGPQLATPGV